MLLRKRAWDMMRDEFATVAQDGTLADVISAVRESMKESPENHAIVVLGRNKKLKGIISIWSVLKAVEGTVLKDENLKLSEDTDWDKAFSRACKICTSMDVEDHMEIDVPRMKPNDPLLMVLETFLKTKKSWAVVEEGGRVIGMLYVGDVYRELSRDMVKAF
ncbi:MAG: HPP family protein [Desulfovibrio sp.]